MQSLVRVPGGILPRAARNDETKIIGEGVGGAMCI